jgi:hypothetical protein
MGKQVQIVSGFTAVVLPTAKGSRPFNGGDITILTDGEYSALPQSVSRALTVLSTVTDPARPGFNPNSNSTASQQYVDAAIGAAGLKLDGQSRVLPKNDRLAPLTGIYFNSYTLNDATNTDITTSSLAAVEADLGVTADFALSYYGLSPNATTFGAAQWTKVQNFLDAGRRVCINVALNGTLANINAGQFDVAMADLGARILAYVAANPSVTDRIMVKFMHELNLTTSYAWCVFTSQNLTDNGSSIANTITSSITAFRRISTLLKNAATDSNGRRWVDIVFELGATNDQTTNANTFVPYDNFYPGDAYVDIISTNIYNRFSISSGVGYWSSFEQVATPPLEAFRRFAPTKPIMIGEASSMDGGMVNSVSVTTGGTGYSAGTTATVVGGGGQDATITLTIAGGVITGTTVTNRGRGYNDQTTISLANTGGGTGAALQANLVGEKFSKGEWFTDAMSWVKDQTDVRYVTWFFTNIGSAGDLRFWAPNTPDDKKGWFRGYGVLTGRVKTGDGLTRRHRVNANLAPDPYCNDVSQWTAAGSNVGTLSRTAATQNIPGWDAALSDNWGCMRLTHNGTASADPTTNRFYCIVPAAAVTQNENFVLTFDARFKPSGTAPSGDAWLAAGLETNDASAFFRKLVPPMRLSSQWKRYRVHTYMTSGSAGARICFAIGSATLAGQLLIANVKLEYGEHATPLLPPQRQLSRTTVQDAAYTFVSGSTDELVAYTTLTAARAVTLPDATLVPRGRMITVKDEAGTAATNNLTVGTTGGQTIDGAATKVINTAFGFLRVYSSGAQWFTC